MPSRIRRKVDKNQREVVDVIRSVWGWSNVIDASHMGGGFPDIVVGVAGVNILLEIKSKKGKLTPAQRTFFSNWKGSAFVVSSPEEALSKIEHSIPRRIAQKYRELRELQEEGAVLPLPIYEIIEKEENGEVVDIV